MFKFGTVQQKDILFIPTQKKELENERYFLLLVDISLSITTQLIIEIEHQIKSKRESGIINCWTRNQTRDPCDTRQV
jgi:hypothetical protein